MAPFTSRLIAGVVIAAIVAAVGVAQHTPGPTGWSASNYDQSANRYSPLTQITPANVSTLQRAWSIHLKPAGYSGRLREDEAIPIVIGNTMYVGSPYGAVIALDATSGAERWRFQLPNDDVPAKRGVAYWPGGGGRPASIVFGSNAGRSTRSRRRTERCNDWFGDNGIVNLKTAEVMLTGMNVPYSHAVVSDHLQEPDHHRRGHRRRAGRFQRGLGPAGDTRAWDATTGKLVWTFHTVPRPGEFGYDTWGGESAKNRSGVNVWGYMSLDAQRGILYMPLGAPNNDRVGIDRPGDNLFSSSVVAVDANTGKYLWHFQLVHHDIWDYDAQSAPLVVDLQRGAETIPALLVVNKTGLLFSLNRVTGKPIFDIVERPVPKSEVPGEQASPTQPFPVKPEPLTQMTISRDNLYKGEPQHQSVLRTHGGRQQHEARRPVYADCPGALQHVSPRTPGRHQLLGTCVRSQAASVRVEHHEPFPADASGPAARRQLDQCRTARGPSPLRRSRPASAVRPDAVGTTGCRQHGHGRHRVPQDARRVRHAAGRPSGHRTSQHRRRHPHGQRSHLRGRNRRFQVPGVCHRDRRKTVGDQTAVID